MSAPMRLLCLSNGHGEDTIAVKILQALQAIDPDPGYAVLPLVGDGKAYDALSMPKVGETKAMPSGGFVYMDGRQLMRDLHGGLLQLTWQQLRTIKHWGKKPGFVLAVGDLVPLLFAWWSGLPYAFVGTAKSEYYLRDEVGPLQRQSWWARREGWSGSVYLPWERWFMHHKRCQAIFPRDRLTADVLQTFDLPVYDLGNPMMDGLMDYTKSQAEDDSGAPLIIALLPGSRAPEAIDNWTRILQSLDPIAQIRPVPEWNRPQLRFVAAIAPGLDLAPLHQALEQNGWSARQSMGALDLPGEFALDTHGFRKGRLHLYISQQSFAQT
ncbi:MAG: lipid-A-disaccharide synthase-related protein, partial [Cyanobacteria bacterium P01_H01_bin.121]